MNNILTLSSIDDSAVLQVGERAIDLSRIHKAKFDIPMTFIVPNILFHEFLSQNKLTAELTKILDIPTKSEDDFADIYARIKTLFEYAFIPKEFHEELLDAYETLSGEKMDVQALINDNEPIVNLIVSPSYACRSEKFSGVLLNIHGFENFLNALKSCWLALYTPEHLKIRDEAKIADFTTGIIVQRFIPTESTVDANSKNPKGTYDISMNAYLGLPDITGSITKDFYSISRETFGIEAQEVKPQEHILLKNSKSGTLIKRSLGKKGATQKIIDKNIFELARLIERISEKTHLHLRIIIQTQGSQNLIFFADRKEKRTAETDDAERKQNNIQTSQHQESPTTNESLSDLLSAPVTEDTEEPVKKSSDAFAWETTIKSGDNPPSSAPVKAIQLEEKESQKENNSENILQDNSEKNSETNSGIFAESSQEPKSESKSEGFEENIDDFIIAPVKTENHPEKKDATPANETFLKEELMIDNIRKEESKEILGPDNEFFMSIILDLEPGIDQEIMKRYQAKFNEVPADISKAMEKLEENDALPEKEQIFKLKSMKEMLERGEKINLDVFLDITEKLRRAL